MASLDKDDSSGYSFSNSGNFSLHIKRFLSSLTFWGILLPSKNKQKQNNFTRIPQIKNKT